MDDTLFCPICNSKLRNIKNPGNLPSINKENASFVERVCVSGFNHLLQLFIDEQTGKVDLMKLSLTPNFSRLIEIDFYNQKCHIKCFKWSQPEQYIEIDKMLYPDFPDLTSLKEKIAMYIAFS